MNRLYVVSGVTGMTGSGLVSQVLAKEGSRDHIVGFDNFYASSIETVEEWLHDERFEFYEYDINNTGQMEKTESRVRKLKQGFDETVYINCAAVVHTEHFYHVYETYETNVKGMDSFLQQAVRVGAQKFINCSTSEVYSMNSWNEHGGVKESDYITLADAEHSQRTSYAAGKLMTEFFIKDAVEKGKIRGCSIRFANVYSRNERYPKHIIPFIINSFKKDGKVVLLENSRENRRTFLNNYDSCSAVLALANADGALDGSIYNVATDEEVSVIELTEMCAEKMGIKNPVIEFDGFRESDPKRRLLSTEKIRAATSWVPQVSLNQGLEECIAYYLKESCPQKDGI